MKSVASAQIKFISTGGSGNYNVPTLLACVLPAPAKADVDKTVQNITAGGPVTKNGFGKPGDMLEYCVKATNIGGNSATKLGLGDNVTPTPPPCRVAMVRARKSCTTLPAAASST